MSVVGPRPQLVRDMVFMTPEQRMRHSYLSVYENVAVFVFDNNGTIKKITYADIADELGDWELGDLYRTNDPALGGWPW